MINDPSLVARSALAIGLVRRFDFLDDDIDQFSHWAGGKGLRC